MTNCTTMGERLRAIRKELRLTQGEFGARIGVKANTITNYETGTRMPSDAMILSICTAYNLDQHWLRTGEGEPYRQRSREDEIAAFLADVLRDEDDSFRRQLVGALARLDAADWLALATIAQKLKEDGPV